jgi:hypothetical protein
LSSTEPTSSTLPSEFLELAKKTAACAEAEAYLRSAISRAYFANHVLAVQKATKKFKDFAARGTGDDHERVIKKFATGPTTMIAHLLRSLRRRRNHADYHIDAEARDEECAFCRAGGVGVDANAWDECLAEADKCFAKLLSV